MGNIVIRAATWIGSTHPTHGLGWCGQDLNGFRSGLGSVVKSKRRYQGDKTPFSLRRKVKNKAIA